MPERLPNLTPRAIAAHQLAQEVHFCKRAKQRFGLKLNAERYQHLIRKVRDNLPGTKFLYHQPPDRTVWRVRAGGIFIRVVYDHRTDRLATCLPLNPPAPKPSPLLPPCK